MPYLSNPNTHPWRAGILGMDVRGSPSHLATGMKHLHPENVLEQNGNRSGSRKIILCEYHLSESLVTWISGRVKGKKMAISFPVMEWMFQ